MKSRQIVVKVSKKGNFYTDYKGCKIVVKLTKNKMYKGRIFRGDLNCRLVNSDNLKHIFSMAIDHIDKNY